jgi:hypothetical protein
MPAPDSNKIEPEELDGEMRMRGLHFGRGCRQRDAQRLLSIDAEVRDFLVRAIAPARR